MFKHKLSASALLVILFSLCFYASSYAFYRSDTVTVSNSFGIPRTVYISFDSASGSGNMSSISLGVIPEVRLPANSFVRTGYSFAGWSYTAGSSETLLPDTADVSLLPADATHITLYASWSANQYTVSFDPNEGSGDAPSDLICSYDRGYDIPACSLSRSDHLFLGWNTEADGSGEYISPTGRIYNLSSSPDAQISLYAQWEDESDSVIETNWNKHADDDSSGSGTPDRMELAPGGSLRKDPSLKNHTDREVYGYMLASVPAVSVSQSAADEQIQDIAVLNITPHWKLIRSDISSDTAAKSSYLYRYDKPLKAHGSLEANPYHPLRRADRSTDLMSGFTIAGNISDTSSTAYSIDITGVFIETSVAEDEADQAALSALGM